MVLVPWKKGLRTGMIDSNFSHSTTFFFSNLLNSSKFDLSNFSTVWLLYKEHAKINDQVEYVLAPYSLLPSSLEVNFS